MTGEWQQSFPETDGYYWFVDAAGRTTIAEVSGTGFYIVGSDLWCSEEEFDLWGWCCPVTPPPLLNGGQFPRPHGWEDNA